jgi:hypothetical protein
MSVKIVKPKIELEKVGIHHIKDGIEVHLFDVNYFEFNDVRIQIKNNGLTDYYVKYESDFLSITPEGQIENWPSEMFSMMDEQLRTILGWD